MRASLDTNVIIHLYRAELQNILFDFFDEGVFIYEQIYTVELKNHGADIIDKVKNDIETGRIEIYTDQKLKDLTIYKIFEENVKDNKLLYESGDLGEVYAISLALTLGAFSIVTDDTKQGGPYMSLLQFESEIIPLTFVDILILRYLAGMVDEFKTVEDFNIINDISELNWSFKSHLRKFLKRFFYDSYKQSDKEWISRFVEDNNVKLRSKIDNLWNIIN